MQACIISPTANVKICSISCHLLVVLSILHVQLCSKTKRFIENIIEISEWLLKGSKLRRVRIVKGTSASFNPLLQNIQKLLISPK